MTSTTSSIASSLIRVIQELYPGHANVGLHEPTFDGNEIEYVIDVVRSRAVSSVGKYVGRFEELVAEATGSARAIATVNGTAALHVALYLAGVGRDDLVVTQPLTFVATANAIHYCGAEPVFVDVDSDTLGLSPQAVRRFLEEDCTVRSDGTVLRTADARRIAAVVPMHTFGFPARMTEIATVCEEFGLPLVEDAAEALGSSIGDRHVGLYGTAGVFSFNGNKTITTGGGGMIVTNDESFADRAKHVTTTAKVPHRWAYVHDEIGFNYRMPNINAALGCAQIEQLESKLAAKRRIAQTYDGLVSAAEWRDAGFAGIAERPGTTSNYWLYALRCSSREQRDEILAVTNDQGISTRPVWELMYRLPSYRTTRHPSCPIAEALADTVLNLPSWPAGEQ